MKLIFTQTVDGVMGDHEISPWHFPEEVDAYTLMLAGETVIFDWNSWRSQGNDLDGVEMAKALVVANGDPAAENSSATGPRIFNTFEEARAAAPVGVWVMGGQDITSQALPLADLCIVVETDLELSSGIKAPEISVREWEIVFREGRQSKTGVLYTVITRVRRRPPGEKPADFVIEPEDQAG